MKLIHTDKRLFKTIHAIVLSSMILNIFVPVVHAATQNPSVEFFLQGVKGDMPSPLPIAELKHTNHVHTVKNTLLEEVAVVTAPVATLSTGGPGQAESSGFSLGSTDNMVDKFTGDFSYSIPLADIEGYPIVLNYSSAISMNSEASWVGLGWDLNVGSVSREMRGLPDEFNGEQTIDRTFNQAEDLGYSNKLGVFAGAGYVLPGGFFTPTVELTALKGKYFTDYLGIGKTFDFGLKAEVSIGAKEGLFIAPSFGLGYSSDSKRGIGKSHAFGLETGITTPAHNRFSAGASFGKSSNSRLGMTERTGQFLLSAKTDKLVAGYGATSSITYGTATSVPALRFNSYSHTESIGMTLYAGQKLESSLTYRVGLKVNNSTISANTVITGPNQRVRQPALGYFHSGKRKAYESATGVYSGGHPLMDFNRSSDFEFSQQMSNLPFSIQTYDIFRVNAMGIGATFRGRRHDVGTYYDPTLMSTTEGEIDNATISAMFEVVPPLPVTLGVGGSTGSSIGQVKSGNMHASGSSVNVLEFQPENRGNNFDARVYFKGVGEPTPENMADFDALGKMEPTYLKLQEQDQETIELSSIMNGKYGFSTTVNSTVLNQYQPIVQASYYEPFTTEQYAQNNPAYSYYSENQFPAVTPTQILRTAVSTPNTANAPNLLSAVEITNTGGTKYVFGIPAYELLSSQVSFAAAGIPYTTSGVISYSSGDNSIDNSRGISNYFDRTDVPAFAHSFLLTAMLSSDYIDRSNNGPSLDDIGSYYKFNYTRIYGDGDGQSRYLWKYPMGDHKAMMAKGLLGTREDDIANYSYGEKEIWYTHSVESKNLVAEFYLLDRDDACGVIDEDGSIDTNRRLKKLDKIVIYNRADRTANGAAAVALQVIQFEYSYELCKNLPSNLNSGTDASKSGKLTLTSIRSYTGTSTEMGLYAYHFTYDAANNPDFSYGNSDAWGNYKLSAAGKPNDLFPYAEQDELLANASAKSWKLIKVLTPARGTLEIEHEADSYATVQDRRVMKHMDITALTNLYDFQNIQSSSTWNAGTSTAVYRTFYKNMTGISGAAAALLYLGQFGAIDLKQVPNNVIVFKLDRPITGSLTTEAAGSQLRSECFTDAGTNTVLKELLIKLHVKVKDAVEEFLPTFCRIADPWGTTETIGVMPKSSSGADYEYGYIITNPAIVEDEKHPGVVFNSLQLSALEFVRRNLPDVLYGTCPTCIPNNLLDKAVALKGEDINRAMNRLGWVPEILTGYSSVRLYIPSNKKYGGGSRVKALTYTDNWQELSGEYDGIYRWNYEYPKRSEVAGNASFEPRTMIDECALYKWNTYVNIVKHFPDESKFTPTPITSMLFPTPVTGYEKVKVSISGTGNKGYSISEFHTSRTHPVIENISAIDKFAETHQPKNFLTGKTTDRYGFSQGFVIRTNDFHGRPHQSMVFDLDDAANGQAVLQARSTYFYAATDASVTMSDRQGNLEDQRIALEYDMHADSRYIENSFSFQEAGLTVALKIISIVPPVVFPFILPSYSQSKRTEAFYAHAFIKHLNTSAIVKKVETETFGSVNGAENLIYDRFSGNVIMSSLKDEYNDLLYSLNYPAHWAYHELRDISGSKVNRFVTATIGTNGTITSAVYNSLSPGDRVRIASIPGSPVIWIAKRNAWTDDQALYLMQADGTSYAPSAGSYQLEIISSNRDNRLDEIMQSIVTKKKPVTGSTLDATPTEIISAGAVTYNDRNNVKCGTPAGGSGGIPANNEVTLNATLNPYLTGVRGDLTVDAQYAWQSARVTASHDYKTRFDGAYTSYFPLYSKDNTGMWRLISQTGHPNYAAHEAVTTTPKWRKLGMTTTYNQFGSLLESKDQINVYSSILYGYDRTFNLVPIAQAVNARQQDIAFDGFEDYAYYSNLTVTNNNPHFDFKGVTNTSVDATQRHSGLYSLKVNAGASPSISKVAAAGVSCDIGSQTDTKENKFTVGSCNCVKDFEPVPGNYIIGAWVKNDNPAAVSNGQIKVAVTGLTTLVFTPSGPVIDGWQRVEGSFTIPAGGVTITVTLNNLSASLPVNFDDLRIHPLLAAMTTTVYHPKTLLPLATHDSYNFTTFYNYDDNLNLVRVRVETTEGIKTVSESELGGYKTYTTE